MNRRHSIILALLLLLVASAAAAQEKRFPPRDLKPVSQVFINGLADLGNIQVTTTFQCGTTYRADWDLAKGAAWVKLTGTGFAFYDNRGQLRVHAFTADPPSALHGFTPGIRYARIPDYSLQNTDSTIPVEVFQYRLWYRRWQTRPCVDITDSLLPHGKYAKAWSWLVQRNQTEAVRYLLGEMGLDPTTGLPPYASLQVPPYNGLSSALAEVSATPYEASIDRITDEGVDFAQYNDNLPFQPFCEQCLTDEQIVSRPTLKAAPSFLASVSVYLQAGALLLSAGAGLFFTISARARRKAAALAEKNERVR